MSVGAQNPRIKCYFNHPVNNEVSTGLNAVYLNSTFDDSIAAYINRAKYTVDIALYNYTSNVGGTLAKVATAANNAYSRGVRVRWVYDGSSGNTGISLLNAAIPRIASPTTAAYGIMHNKFMVIDAASANANDAWVLSGSYNWSATQTTSDFNNIILIQDQPLAQAFVTEFQKMWGSTGANPNAATAVFGPFKTPSTQSQFNVGGTLVEVFFSPKDTTLAALKKVVRSAGNDLFAGIYAFTDTSLANRMADRYRAGVAVRAILDQFSMTYTSSTNTPYYILSALLGAKLQLYVSASSTFHNKVMVADALDVNSDPQVATGSYNWSFSATTSNDENLLIIHDAAITNQYYQALCEEFTTLGGIPCSSAPCGADTIVVSAKLRGNSYQWQVDNGTGYANISNGANYSGATSSDLIIYNAPTTWYGYQYRCVVNGVPDQSVKLQFISYWNGSFSTAWNEPRNWNCGKVPDAQTDVVVVSGVPRFPIVGVSTSCRSIRLQQGAYAQVAVGVALSIVGQ